MNKVFYYIILAILGGLRAQRGDSLVGITLVMIAVLFFIFNQHVALGLIQLELLTITGAALVIILGRAASINPVFTLILFSVGVIEGALGLSILALCSRSQRAELFKLTI